MNAYDRVLRQLRAAGRLGVTQVQFLEPVCDGGEPILRVAPRVCDLRADGYPITGDGTAANPYVLQGARRTPPTPKVPDPDGACDKCGAPVIWVDVGGERVPCAPLPVLSVAIGLIARNPTTGGGRQIITEDLMSVPGWLQAGAVLHRSHLTTCPMSSAHAAHARDTADRPGQASLL